MLKAHLRKKHTKSYWYVFLFMHFFMELVIPAMTGSRVPIPCIKAVKKRKLELFNLLYHLHFASFYVGETHPADSNYSA